MLGITSPRRPKALDSLKASGHWVAVICAKEMLGVATRCAAGAQLYKTDPWAEDLYLLSFPHRSRFPPPFRCSERTAALSCLVLPRTTTSHVNQDPHRFRSKSTSFKEEKMEQAPILAPHTVWEPSVLTEE
jgi:hypothetical protein